MKAETLKKANELTIQIQSLQIESEKTAKLKNDVESRAQPFSISTHSTTVWLPLSLLDIFIKLADAEFASKIEKLKKEFENL